MKKLIFSVITILFTSCMAFYNGAISSGPLLSANDRYIDVATGYAKASYFLGLGGLNKIALVYQAKKNLMASRPLKQGEYYSNFTVDFRKMVSVFSYMTNEVFVHADVLSTSDSARPIIVTNSFKIKNNISSLQYVKTAQDSFYVSEKILYTDVSKEVYLFTPYEIISFIGKDNANLKNLNDKSAKNINVKVYEILYSMDKERNGFKYGDSVSYKSQKIFSDKIAKGKIIGTAVEGVLVLEDNKTVEITYKELTKITKK